MASEKAKLIDLGLRVADDKIYDENDIWCAYSSDKVDIGQRLMEVLRTLFKALPLSRELRALSIGCGTEPQYKILEPAFRGGLYLLDIDKRSLNIIDERIHNQGTDHVTTLLIDYNKAFIREADTQKFLAKKLKGQKLNLIALYHSLYYSSPDAWTHIFQNVFQNLMATTGAVHAVLMASKSEDPTTTTWLYNHFAGKFFGEQNDQDLAAFAGRVKKMPLFQKTKVASRTSRVHFVTDDFGKFMAVIWMILLYPEVHQYSLPQREEITEYVYNNFWIKKQPLIQEQNHLVVFRGIG
jgi:hypothetical protein